MPPPKVDPPPPKPDDGGWPNPPPPPKPLVACCDVKDADCPNDDAGGGAPNGVCGAATAAAGAKPEVFDVPKEEPPAALEVGGAPKGFEIELISLPLEVCMNGPEDVCCCCWPRPKGLDAGVDIAEPADTGCVVVDTLCPKLLGAEPLDDPAL